MNVGGLQDLAGGVLVLAFLIAIIAFMLRGMRPVKGFGRYGAKRWSDIGRYRSLDDAFDWPAPLLAMIALTEMSSLHQVQPSAVLGGSMAFVAALVPAGLPRTVFNTMLSVFAVYAAAIVGSSFVTGDGCSPRQLGVRITALVLVVICLVVGAVLGRLVMGSKGHSAVGLSAFGAVEFVVLVSSPLGVEVVGPAKLAQVAVALGAGFFAGAAPGIFLTLAAPLLTLVLFTQGSLGGTACTGGPNGSALGMLVTFGVAYLIVKTIRNRAFA